MLAQGTLVVIRHRLRWELRLSRAHLALQELSATSSGGQFCLCYTTGATRACLNKLRAGSLDDTFQCKRVFTGDSLDRPQP